MTSTELLDYLCRYQAVRGWRAKRVHLTLTDLMDLRATEPGAHYHSTTWGMINFTFDGAVIYPVRSATVAALIRQWDLAP